MPTLKCYIMRGCSGSGKSTYVKKHFPKATVLSTDDFWLDPVGNYVFDSRHMGIAHAWNLRRFVDFVAHWGDYTDAGGEAEVDEVTVVVDNTNTTIAEIAPYAAVAAAFGFEVEIITLNTIAATAAPRNVHGVPEKTVAGQYDNMVRNHRAIPSWWKHTIIEGNYA